MNTVDLQIIKNRYDIIGNNAKLNLALETAMAVAASDLAVLVSGESGVGKDVISRIIHENSNRRSGPYLAINCGAIPSGTINAELFGHEKGSFTGAIATRKGYFEEADSGTLFLDEIGELPKDTQALLLRVLQDGEYMKVGSSKVEKTDVRVVAATNANLQHMVAEGKFREDLYYRLNAINIQMPPLRERKDDIYLLFRKFTSDFAEKNRLCKISLEHDAIAMLKAYRWPGNIRQLKNFTEALTVLESKPSSPGMERMELSASSLAAHLPQEQDSLLPAMQDGAHASGESSISQDNLKAIIKVLLDLRQEVNSLKKELDMLKSGQVLPKVEAPAFEEAEWQESRPEHIAPEEDVQEMKLSLKNNNDELIRRTLEKYNGKPKEAAKELGISERTIYRWLEKQKKNV